jgi:hypothetical protein
MSSRRALQLTGTPTAGGIRNRWARSRKVSLHAITALIEEQSSRIPTVSKPPQQIVYPDDASSQTTTIHKTASSRAAGRCTREEFRATLRWK